MVSRFLSAIGHHISNAWDAYAQQQFDLSEYGINPLEWY